MCKNFNLIADVLSRYLSALSSGENRPDSSLMAGVEQEIERSKKLVGKLRQSLKGERNEDFARSEFVFSNDLELLLLNVFIASPKACY